MKNPTAEQILKRTFDHLEEVLDEQKSTVSGDVERETKNKATEFHGKEEDPEQLAALE